MIITDFSTAIVMILMIAIPGLLLTKQKNWKAVAALSPAFWAYALGIIIGNLIPLHETWIEPIQDVTVALAIPLLLFSANLVSWKRLAIPTLTSLLIWVPVVMGMAACSSLLYQEWFEQPDTMAAMASSVYTGGTPNMYAVHRAVGADIDLFNQMNLSDLMFSGSYLMVVLTLVPGVLRRFLPKFKKTGVEVADTEKKHSIRIQQVLLSLGAGLLVVILAGGISWVLAGGEMGQTFQMWIIIWLAVGGLLASTWKPLQKLPGTYATGEYLFLIFCLAVGSRVNLEDLLTSAPMIILFMGTTALGSVILHSFIAKLFRIDADTVLITHVAGIFGSPFIGPVAEKLDNKEIIVSGMTLGVINLAIGNMIGIWEFSLLNWI